MALDVVPNSVVAASAVILVPSTSTLVGATSTYQIIDNNGVIWVNGSVGGMSASSAGTFTAVNLTTSLNIPSTIPPSTTVSYNLIWTLTLTSGTVYTAQEIFNVLPLTATLYGPTSTIELLNTTANATLNLLTQTNPTNLSVTVNQGNTQRWASTGTITPVQTYNGYLSTVTVPLSTPNLIASLAQLSVVWTYTDPFAGPVIESGSLYLVTPSMLTMISDIRSAINKARLEFNDDQLPYNPIDLMAYARQGGDFFNGFGQSTNFDFTYATGPVRYFWGLCSSYYALRAQALSEGVRAFQYSGQAIQLEVNRSQYYTDMANSFREDLEQHLTPFKILLSKRGQISGPGNIDPTSLGRGAIGSVGIALSPVSNVGLWNSWGFGASRPGYV